MARTKGAVNLAPTLDGRIYVRCYPELKQALAKVLKNKGESAKVVQILEEYLAPRGLKIRPKEAQ